MIEVTQEEFFKVMGPLNVHPTPTGDYPYLSIWKDQRTGAELGRSQDRGTGKEAIYYLREDLVP